jgi:aspartyl-tRNA(Asn)/glutamyl-tRNA(Gln) amidotransferase subunit C
VGPTAGHLFALLPGGRIETLTPGTPLLIAMTDDTADTGVEDDGAGGSDAEAVDAGTVEHVAGLARVDLAAGERERFVEQFADILGYFETLDEVPAVERDPELTNVMRPDEAAESLDREAALENAAETEDGQFKGPRVS